MKSLLDKFFANTFRLDLFLLIVPFILWAFCFRYFLTGFLGLEADAVSYSDQIGFYTDNLSKGVFPLWNPDWCNGAPYHFFLRRIGDVNPLLFILVAFKWLGFPFLKVYLIFLAFYYFLAGWAFYLITRFLLKDRFYAFAAYILFLFSSWGSEIFYNYIIIIFVPIIWFFYFLLCFSREARKKYFLGMCLCAGLMLTTYIPFFFFTILTIFAFFYVIFYGKTFIDFLRRSIGFFFRNKIFTVFCIIFLLVSAIPGLIFYKESKNNEFILPNRHSGAEAASAVAVSAENVASGDIVSHGYFDRIFEDQAHIDMGDIYIPYIFFLVLLTTALGRVNKLIFFLLFNILGLSLITITSVAGMHRFLYEHIIIFKFIRNIYYFFWLAMLPMGLLLAVTAFKSLLTAIEGSSRKAVWLIFIIFCHLVFVLFLFGQKGVLGGAWAAIFISSIYFMIYFRFERKISYPAGFCLLLLAVFIQSVQVYGFLDDKLFQAGKAVLDLRRKTAGVIPKSKLADIGTIKGTVLDPNNKNGIWEDVSLTQVRLRPTETVTMKDLHAMTKGDFGKFWPFVQKFYNYPPLKKRDLYYSTRWYSILVDYIDPKVLYDYVDEKFIFYDNVVPYVDAPKFFKVFETTVSSNANIAYVPNYESQPGDWRSDPRALSQADIDPIASGKLSVLRSDANTWVLRTHLAKSQFLVLNDNYDSHWHAFINGHQARLLRANVSFKGLWVPSGDSTIVLRFSTPRDYIFHYGMIILFAGTFLYLLLLFREEYA